MVTVLEIMPHTLVLGVYISPALNCLVHKLPEFFFFRNPKGIQFIITKDIIAVNAPNYEVGGLILGLYLAFLPEK